MIRAPVSKAARLTQQPHELALEDTIGSPAGLRGWGEGWSEDLGRLRPLRWASCPLPLQPAPVTCCPPSAHHQDEPWLPVGGGVGAVGVMGFRKKKTKNRAPGPLPHGSKTAVVSLEVGTERHLSPRPSRCRGHTDAQACVLPLPPPASLHPPSVLTCLSSLSLALSLFPSLFFNEIAL